MITDPASRSLAAAIIQYDPEVAFRVDPDQELPGHTLAVDYNLTRLLGRRAQERCAELQDVRGPVRRLLIEVSSQDPYPQVRYDLATAARLVEASGELLLLSRERKLSKRLTEFAAGVFEQVEAGTSKRVVAIRCAKPRPIDHGPPDGPVVDVVDPLTHTHYRLETWPGLFSGRVLDAGTTLLLDNLPALDHCAVLDVGCGYGPLSVVAAGRGAQLTYADVDARALRLTAENLAMAGLSGQPLLSADLGDVQPRSHDLVISNPPTHAGSDTLKALFDRMVAASRLGGDVRIVLRRHLNYEKWMRAFDVEKIDDRAGYKVLKLTARA